MYVSGFVSMFIIKRGGIREGEGILGRGGGYPGKWPGGIIRGGGGKCPDTTWVPHHVVPATLDQQPDQLSLELMSEWQYRLIGQYNLYRIAK